MAKPLKVLSNWAIMNFGGDLAQFSQTIGSFLRTPGCQSQPEKNDDNCSDFYLLWNIFLVSESIIYMGIFLNKKGQCCWWITKTLAEEYIVRKIIHSQDKKVCQGILKGEVSLYYWPLVWLVWNKQYDNWIFFAKQTNPNQSNRRSMVQWYFPL